MIHGSQPVSPGRLLAGLVARGYLSAADALDGVVTLEDLSRSNPVTAVAVDGAPRYVVKQRGIRVDDVDPLAAEGVAYGWLASVGLADIAPRARSSVTDEMLVLDRIDGAPSLYEVMVTRSSGAPLAFAALGLALGRLHAAGRDVAAALGLVPRRPWILDLETHGLPSVVPATDAVTAVRSRLLESSAVSGVIAGLGASAAGRAVVHGDVKFDNVLVLADPVRVCLIDWELAGLGEPGWDVAGIVEGTLTAQLFTGGRIDVPTSAELVRPALDAYGMASSMPEPSSILEWTVARLAQASLQLAAMSGEEPAAETQAMDVADLAISVAAEPLAWGAVIGMPVATS